MFSKSEHVFESFYANANADLVILRVWDFDYSMLKVSSLRCSAVFSAYLPIGSMDTYKILQVPYLEKLICK